MINIKLSNEKIYPILLVVYALAGTAAFILSLVKGLNREHIGLALLIGSILSMAIILVPKKATRAAAEAISDINFKFTVIIWLVVFMFSVLLLLDSLKTYTLSLPYYLSICLMVLAISYQILSSNKFSNARLAIILGEILILAFYLSASTLFLFQVPIGADAYFHTQYISQILNSGSLYISESNYENYPVYQLTFVGTMLLSSIGDVKIAQLVLAFIQVLALVFVFILCNKIFEPKIALLSTLLISLSAQVILPRYSFYPSNYAVIYYMLLLFALFCLKKEAYKGTVTLVLLLAINFMHPVVGFVSSFTIIFIYVASKLLKIRDIVDLRYVAISIVLLILQYFRPTETGARLSSQLDLALMQLMTGVAVVTKATSSPYYSYVDILLYELGFALLIAFGVCGALVVLKLSENNIGQIGKAVNDRRTLLSLITLFIIPIPYLEAFIAPDMLPDRWFVFITVFLGIFAAIALCMFAEVFKKFTIVVLLIIQLIVFFSITTPISSPNASIYSQDLSMRPAIQSEVIAANFFKDYVNPAKIAVSAMYLAPINSTLDIQDHFLDPGDTSYKDKVLIVRNFEMEKGFIMPLFGNNGQLLENIKANDTFMNYTGSIDKFYENGDVRAYRV
ncbi:MAG TPA: hypothetical protein VMC84_03465 [Methanocella sp.]|uniref:hypothetical protein n=1 Tax=Methanocella sp. TaxID=2052833 RepID=UPI002D07BD4A|nr:hypothetical protein [Methanocella sp.]HTY90212.1 hypothetical protein [Methanocella sp.]